MNVQITPHGDSTILIEGEIEASEFEKHRAEVLKELSETLSIDGFRKGNIPEAVIIKHVGEMNVLESMAQHAFEEAYPKILIEKDIDAVGRPEVSITKIAAGNPLGFRVIQAVLPTITLPDVEKIAKEVLAEPGTLEEATDEEVEAVLQEVHAKRLEQKNESGETTIPLALDDAFAQSLGEFKTLDELRGKLKENIVLEKKFKERDRRRIAVMEKLIAETPITIPAVLIDRELETLVAEMKDRIESIGMTFEDYLKNADKNEDQFRESLRPDARKRAAYGLILDSIAQKYTIDVPKDDLDRETERILSLYQGADPHAARHYAEGVLRNERVFKFLESFALETPSSSSN